MPRHEPKPDATPPPPVRTRLLAALRTGEPRSAALRACGLPRNSFRRWRALSRAGIADAVSLLADADAALDRYRAELLAALRQIGEGKIRGNPSALIWLLERTEMD